MGSRPGPTGRAALAGALAALILTTAGCGWPCRPCQPEIRYLPQRVEIPVSAPVPPPPPFERPPLPIETIPDTAPPSEVIRRYAATVLLLIGEVEARDLALDVYRGGTTPPACLSARRAEQWGLSPHPAPPR